MRMCRRLVHHQNATNSVNYSPPRIGQGTFIPLPNNDPLSHKCINHKAFTNIHPKLNPCGPTRVPMTATSSGQLRFRRKWSICDAARRFGVMRPYYPPQSRVAIFWHDEKLHSLTGRFVWQMVSFFFIPIQKQMLPSGVVTRTALWPGPVDRIAVIKSGKRAVFRKC